MAELQQDRVGGGEPPERRGEGEEHFDHVAVGYTNRSTLDDFIEGEGVDLVIRGPIHTGQDVADVGTMGAGVTEGTPCLVVPLVRERIDEIQREVSAVLNRFQSAPPSRRRAEGERPHSYRETGGSARGTSSGSQRRGSLGGR